MTFLFLKLKEKWGKTMSHKQIMNMILEKMVETEFPKPKTRKPHIPPTSKNRVKKMTQQKSNPEKTVNGDRRKSLWDDRDAAKRSLKKEARNTKNSQIKTSPLGTNVESSTKNPHRTAIPAQQKRDTLDKTNRKCAYCNCNKPATRIHHLTRYFNNREHEELVGVCDDHHQFFHNGLIPNEQDDPNNWKINLQSQTN